MKRIHLAFAAIVAPTILFAQTPAELCIRADKMVARHQFATALATYQRAGNSIQALKGQGEVCLLLYDTPQALSAFSRALETAQKESVEAADIMTCQGEAWLQFNNTTECYKCIEHANDIYHKLGLTKSYAGYARLLRLNGDRLMLLGNIEDGAISHFEAARKLYAKTIGNNCSEELKACLHEAEAYTAARQYGRAWQCLESIMNQPNFYKDTSDDHYVEAMRLALQIAAEQHEDELVLQIKNVMNRLASELTPGAINVRLLRDYHVTEGVSWITMGHFQKAAPMLQKAFAIQRDIAHSHLSYLSENERLQMWGSDYSVMNAIFALNRSIVKDNAETNALLYDAALLSKGLLLNASASLARCIATSGDADLKADFARLGALQREALLTNGAESEEQKTLQRSILKRARTHGDFMGYTNMTWQHVCSKLKDNEAAVEFVMSVIGNDTVYSALVLRNNYKYPKQVAIKDDGLEGVWKNIRPLLKEGDKVMFSTTGKYNSIGIEYHKLFGGRYAYDVFDLRRLTSTRVIAEERKHKTGENKAVVFYGLEYGVNRETHYPIKDLPYSVVEGEGVCSSLEMTGFSVDKYLEYDGTEQQLYAYDGHSPKIMHLSTHGYYDDKINAAPLFQSYLQLSNCGEGMPVKPYPDATDNIATAAEIATLDLSNTQLAVLAACKTALGEVTPDGTFGLQRAFKQAGVSTIMMTLKNVNDEKTATLMSLFYGHLVKGMTATTALRMAQRDMKEDDAMENWKHFVILDDIN